MASVTANERSWAINIISEINILLRNNSMLIKMAGGESTISADTIKETKDEYDIDRPRSIKMFPDMLLYADLTMTKLIQGWELKMPDTPITDTTFIKDATRKAKALGLNSFVIWNFNDCHFYVKEDTDEYCITKTWSNQLSHIDNREKVGLYQKDWKAVLNEVIVDVNEFFAIGKVSGNNLETIITDNVINVIIEEHKGVSAEYLKIEAAKNAHIDSLLTIWWNENSIEYMHDERDMYHAYSKMLILNWINKIIFANLIKRHHDPAREVEKIVNGVTVNQAIKIFETITSKCDFYNIFSSIDLCDKVSSSTWSIIVELNEFLVSNGINNLDQDVLQSILENTVAISKREIRGQYTTPQILANLLGSISMIDRTGNAIDPCCGTGSIARALLNEKLKHLSVEEAYDSTWGSDKFSFPLQIANIGLTKSDSMDVASKLFQMNVFYLTTIDKVFITNPKTGEKIEHILPKYKTIASNLPFVPFEILSDDDKTKIEEIRESVKHSTGITLDGKSDLYNYIIFTLWEMLDQEGRLGLILSNSWLGTKWGKNFRNALRYYYNIKDVIISTAGKWFDNAQVVTTIMILEKKPISVPDEGEKTNFYRLNVRLSEINSDISKYETVVNSVILHKLLDDSVIDFKEYEISMIESLEEMNISWNALFHDAEWIYSIKDKLVDLKSDFKVFRGERRGWDKLFFPEEGHGIEPAYLKRVLKSSRSITELSVETDSDAFCCSKTMAELQELGHNGAIRWIRKFENGVNGVGKPLKSVLERVNAKWYEMRDDVTADFVTGMNPGERLFVAKFDEPSFINQRLIGLKKTNPSVDVDLSYALLNSVVGMYLIEALGFGRGLGALDISNTNFKEIKMLDPELVSDEDRKAILEAFNPIIDREILRTSKELQMEDRENFDKKVLKAFGIEEYYPRIKESLLSMQKSRLSVR